MKADLHIHSTFSHNAISRPETILETAAQRDIGIIAITDDNGLQGRRLFADTARRYPIQVVFGQEIKVANTKRSQDELLGLFLDRPIKSTSVSQIIAEVAAQGGITSIAHPFCERRGEFRAFDQIDDWSHVAIEVRNGRTFKKRDNQMAEELAERLNLPATAGSDAHTPFEIGNVYIEFDGADADDLKKAILNHDISIGGEPSAEIFTLLSNISRLGISL